MLRRTTIFAVLAVLFAAPSAGAALGPEVRSDYGVYVEAELREPADYRGLGQDNCLAEASIGGTPECPSSYLATPFPSQGVRVLDAVYFSDGLGDPGGDVQSVMRDAESVQSTGGTGGSNNHYVLLADAQRGMSLHRMSNGAVDDVILPGRGSWSAWFGYWDDSVNPDSVIQVHWSGQHGNAKPKSSNEWKPIVGSSLVAYVEPGSHPMPTHMYRPDAYTPDFYLKYVSSEIAYRSEGENQYVTHVIFTDGSLLQDLWVTVVSDPFLAPDGQRPYTATTESLVDVDRHPAAAPGSMGDLYEATLKEHVNQLGSPSVGYCPNACRVGPASGDTPAHEVLASLTKDVYVGYKQESEPDSLSSGAGRDFEAGYAPWVDLIPLWSPAGGAVSAYAGPIPGRNPDGSQTMLPGVLSFELFAGVWRDLNGDGFIGAIRDEADPYESGTRPIADDYYNARGEFFGIYPQTSAGNGARLTTFTVKLTPLTDWGTGVIILDGTGKPCNENTLPYQNCLERHTLTIGTGSIDLAMALDNGVAGHYTPTGQLGLAASVFMPDGSPGFRACVSTLYLRHELGGFSSVDGVHDCDVVARRV